MSCKHSFILLLRPEDVTNEIEEFWSVVSEVPSITKHALITVTCYEKMNVDFLFVEISGCADLRLMTIALWRGS